MDFQSLDFQSTDFASPEFQVVHAKTQELATRGARHGGEVDDLKNGDGRRLPDVREHAEDS